MDSLAAETNAIFMLKIKIDNQMTKVFLEAPNNILDIQHSSVMGNIDSYYDKITIEFYDVINEQNFVAAIKGSKNQGAADDMANLRLLSQKIFDVRDLPFNN
jgi:hypothetical protein